MERPAGFMQVLVPSQVLTASGNSGPLALNFPPNDASFIVQTSAVSGTSPTLGTHLQTSIDGGNTWIDFASCTQITGNITYWIKWSSRNFSNQQVPPVVSGDTLLAASQTLNGPIVPSMIRVRWVIGGTTPSFTLSVTAILN